MLVGTGTVYGADRSLRATLIRPYSDDDKDGEAGNDYYEVQRAAKQKIYKIYQEYADSNITNTYPDAIYCLRAGLGFGSNSYVEGNVLTYTVIGDMLKDEDKDTITNSYQTLTGMGMSDEVYNAIVWIINKAYLPRHAAYTNGVYDDTKSIAEREELKARLLLAAGIQPSITTLTDDDIEVIQQMAIWFFSNYDENGESNSLSLPFGQNLASLLYINGDIGNPVGLTGARMMDIQKLYMYLVEGALANKDEQIQVPNLSFGNTNPQVTEKYIPPGLQYYIVGPFELIGTGEQEYEISSTIQYKKSTGITGEVTIDNVTGIAFITNEDGTDQSRNKQLKDMVNGGEFYLALSKVAYNDVKELSIKVDYSYWATKKAEYMEAGPGNQPVVIIEKEKVLKSIIISTERIEGRFDIELRKVDENGDLIETNRAHFDIRKMPGSVQTYYTTDDNTQSGNVTGIIRIRDILITYEGEEFIYEFEETRAPAGYDGVVGKFLIKITTEKVLNEYKIKNAEPVKYENGNYVPVSIPGVSVSVSNDRTTLEIDVENKKKTEGELNLELRKVDEDGNLILNDKAKFAIARLPGDPRMYYTTHDNTETGNVTGVINIDGIEIISEGEEFIYEIEEITAPIGYTKAVGKFYVQIITEKAEGKFRVKTADIVEYRNNSYEPAHIPGVSLELSADKSSIEITVENIEIEEFDLALRKFITKINGIEVDTRVPNLNLNGLRQKSDTTAIYTHDKEPISVRQGDIIIYTIRVYNEADKDGYASEITDYLPEGLGFLQFHKTNFDNNWSLPSSLPEGSKATKLVGEDGMYSNVNQVKNLSIEDFEGITSLEQVEIIAGKLSVSTNMLERDGIDPAATVIKAYDRDMRESNVSAKDLWQKTSEQGQADGLYYREVQIACIVLAENVHQGAIRNIAEISEAQDENGNDMNNQGDDRDSRPDNVNINTYNPPTENSKYQQDDDDYEQIILKYFDLALRKFITKIDDNVVTSRIPEAKVGEDGDLTYVHPKTPIEVANSQVVTYTIRVYNEGAIPGYAEEVRDDIPEGLQYLPDHATNKKYEWKMYYEEEGELVETNDVSLATEIRTEYLSSAKESSTRQNEIKPFDGLKGISNVAPLNPDYKDIEVAFKVVEPKSTEYNGRVIINTAEITDDNDDDEDSIPDNDKDGEDDIDKEYIYVKYFDLSLIKWVSQAIVTVDGKTTTTSYEMPADDPRSEYVVKVDLDKKSLSKSTVKFVYTIMVINEGEIAGYATQITDDVPEGLEFIEADNPLWSKGQGNKVTTDALENTLLQPGESAKVNITFTWKNSGENVGVKKNTAEISEDYNEYGAKDKDSKPNNWDEKEDDQDFALVILAIRTGAVAIYVPVIVMVLTILSAGVYSIKKYVLM